MNTEHLGWLWTEPENVRDGQAIRAMLVEISPDEARDRHRSFGLDGWEPDPQEHYFECKNFDRATRLCRAYAQRPQMCRDYGQAQPCAHGCGGCR